MRFLVIFLFCFLQTTLNSQSLLNQKIDLILSDISVADALLQLSEKMNCSIYFNSHYFTEDQRVNIAVKNKSFRFVLEKCLDQTGFDFKLDHTSIRIFALPPPIYTISGYIVDSLSGERLVSATIYDQQSGKGTISNEYGFYSLSIPRGEAILNYSYLGFQSKDYQLSIRKDISLKVALNAALTLGEIIVTDARHTPQSTNNPTTIADFKAKKIDKVPSLGGEVDVFRYFQTLAGVQSGSDGIGGMHVRGGEDNQNLVLLDGVPVYNPSHTLGLFSIFNASTIKKASLYKNYFPARYSGRLSSIVDIRTREGNEKAFHGGINIGLLSTSLFAEGPIIKDKTTFLVSARRTHLDPFINQIVNNEFSEANDSVNGRYYFYDANIKLNHSFSEKDRLYLSYYQGRDVIDVENTSSSSEALKELQPSNLVESDLYGILQTSFLNYNWGNTISALRWNHLWTNKLFSNTTFTYSEFSFKNYFGTEALFSNFPFSSAPRELEEEDQIYAEVSLSEFNSKVQDAGVKIDFDYVPNNKHYYRFGAGLLVRQFKPSLIFEQFEQEDDFIFDAKEIEQRNTLLDPTFLATELNVYGEDDFQISDKMKLQYGLHAVLFVTDNTIYPSLQPRLSFQYQVAKNKAFTATFTSMNQFLHVLQSNKNIIPNDLWVPSTAKIKPQQSWQTAVGMHWQISKGFQWTTELYYKKLNRLITYSESLEFSDTTEVQAFDWEEDVVQGEGWSYGLETSLNRTIGKTTGWLNYNLAWSDRQYAGINNNQRFPFRFNRRHEVKLGLSQQFGPKFNLFATWAYGSGQWLALLSLESPEDFFQSQITDPDASIDRHQLKAFHRLDLNANFSLGKKRSHQLTIGAHNVYSRTNPTLAYRDLSEEGSIKEIGWDGMLPTFRYAFEF